MNQIYSTKVTNITLNTCTVKFVRISGLSEQALKKFKWITIDNSSYFYFSFRVSEDPCILAKFYAGLTYFTGPSDEKYDSWKGSYSFMFGIEVKKNDKVSKYCFHIRHCRSYIDFNIIQPVDQEDPRTSFTYDKPNNTLFSEKDIYDFINAFYAYIMKPIEDAEYIPPDFVKCSDSNLLLFGYLKNKYFFESYEDNDLYERRKEDLNQQIYNPKVDFFESLSL